MDNLFETIAELARPKPSAKPSEVFTITAFVGTKKYHHDFIVGDSKAYIETFLINKYGENCWSWE